MAHRKEPGRLRNAIPFPHPRTACLLAAGALLAIALDATLPRAHAQPQAGHDFGIDNGLVRGPARPAPPKVSLAGSTAAYAAEVRASAPGAPPARIELHWLDHDRSGSVRPVMWEPASRCFTPMQPPRRLAPGVWTILPEMNAAYSPGNDACMPARRIGGTEGIEGIRVRVEARGEQFSRRITLQARAPQGAATATYEGDLLPSQRIQSRQDLPRFDEQNLLDYGFSSFDEIYLVTNYGIFKGSDRAAGSGTPGFTVIETTDLYRAFRVGDLFFKAKRSMAAPREIVLTQRERSLDGTRCPDTDGQPVTRVRRLSSMQQGVRTWLLEARAPAHKEKTCVVMGVNARTCKDMGCMQWSDTGVTDAADYILTDDVRHARRIFEKLPRLTLATSGIRYDTSTHTERVRTPRRPQGEPWGECGLEGCDARRRREDIERVLIDLWNR